MPNSHTIVLLPSSWSDVPASWHDNSIGSKTASSLANATAKRTIVHQIIITAPSWSFVSLTDPGPRAAVLKEVVVALGAGQSSRWHGRAAAVNAIRVEEGWQGASYGPSSPPIWSHVVFSTCQHVCRFSWTTSSQHAHSQHTLALSPDRARACSLSPVAPPH